jgi:hypothetical protein
MRIEIVGEHAGIVEKVCCAALIGRIIHALTVDWRDCPWIHKLGIAILGKGNPKITWMRNKLVHSNLNSLAGPICINIGAALAIGFAARTLLDKVTALARLVRRGRIEVNMTKGLKAEAHS